ncbi:MAG TPA: L-serine ammonia-lyase [Candidatus Corynebacterium gallistercoris]|uniref:L-serine ammonia-lyase n=1 Tax=Candidatus Corynebacterium gallistercoris TaxID=2838530 RepID=A0A9D1UQT6_9CORY|nr:L-serine ammonia-lyase [Candidatus Corynebacterium gallistercoris]
MTVSVFDLFQIGVGPSSSHTVGPMRAGLAFARELKKQWEDGESSLVGMDATDRKIADVVTPPEGNERSLSVVLYGSLAATGAGHGTLGACLLSLDGADPATVDPDFITTRLEEIKKSRTLYLAGDKNLPVTCGFEDIILRPSVRRSLHTNAVTFVGFGGGSGSEASGDFKQTYYSIGGGFIRTEEETPTLDGLTGEWLFESGEQLIGLAEKAETSIAQVQRECERSVRNDEEIDANLDEIAQAMEDCAKRGVTFDGVLPGSLLVRRRAKRWYDQLMEEDPGHTAEYSEDWVNLVALAVNEENAAGGRVVTAPTNGAAGIIPAVLFYSREFTPAGRENPRDVNRRFLLTAGAVGSLYKERASISGAEVGCQGEVGSAASMAAAGLAEVLGGTPRQIANAAEIAMEHSLGLTCDPIAGLVQIPCIERNAISAGKAINAAKMAMRGDGEHHVTLDEVIETMRQTGADMSDKYKETAGGGLAINVAVNVPEC